MQLVGASTSAQVTGLNQQTGVSNYLSGSDSTQWLTNIAQYAQVEYQAVYSGVDVYYRGNAQQQLQFDFHVAAGGNPNQIQLNFQGATSVALDASGNLLISVGGQQVIEQAPQLYQTINGVQQAVSGQYVIESATQVGFSIGAYDSTQPLIIDPTLDYSTYLGGSGSDFGTGIAVDSAGNAYVCGYTASVNFTVNGAPFQGSYQGGSYDAFVTKLNAAGNGIVYSTYLGGNAFDAAISIAVDSQGDAYVMGMTNSSNFPTTAGAFQTSKPGFDDFITKLNPAGNGMVYSTFLGGSSGYIWYTYFPFGNISANNATGNTNIFFYSGGIAVDASGDAWVTGNTTSADFPITSGAYQPTYGGAVRTTLILRTRLSRASTPADRAFCTPATSEERASTSPSRSPSTPAATSMSAVGQAHATSRPPRALSSRPLAP